MIVTVSCSCGRKAKLDAEHAGKRFRCPSCDQVMTVPVPSYTVEGLSEEGKERTPRPRPKKPPCFFCGSRKKVTLFQVWTGRRGADVEVRAANDEIVSRPSYHDLIGHEVPVCKPCGRQFCRQHRRWLFWAALGQLIVLVVLTIGLVWGYVALGKRPEAEHLISLVYLDLVCLGLFLGALGTYFFGKTTFVAVEAAIAALAHQEIDPEADAGLSSDQLKELQPRQIHGTPRWADGREEDGLGREMAF